MTMSRVVFNIVECPSTRRTPRKRVSRADAYPRSWTPACAGATIKQKSAPVSKRRQVVYELPKTQGGGVDERFRREDRSGDRRRLGDGAGASPPAGRGSL